MKQQKTYRRAAFGERGMATLVVSVVLLISITLIVLITSQAVITEQRIIANETRAKQAFEAASAGISYGLGYIQSNGADADGDSAIDVLLAGNGWTNVVSGANGASYRVRIVDDVDPGNLELVSIQAQGRSDDQSAIRSMSLTISGTPSLANPPGNPLTARGFINLNGSGTITNLEATTTIWSGDEVDVTAMSANTIIKHPTADGGIESTNASNKGADIVDNDPSLSTLSDTEYFQNFFGLTESNYRSSVVGTDIDPDVTSVSTLDGESGTVIWVEGNADFTGTPVIGTADNPVVLIVNGNMFGAGDVTVNGILYITGNKTGAGNLTLNGATIIRGNMDGTGSLDLFFDSDLLDNLDTAGKAAGMPGTWTDFPGFTW
ncbi:MAG: PilX N-terminal domain-containing pilus assembly protein [Amphritea sp.]